MPGDGDGGRDGGSVATDGSPVPTDGNSGPAYTEALCADPLPSLAMAEAAYQNTPAGVRAASLAIAAVRYPIATAFINEQTDMHLMTWYRNRATFAGILDGFEVAVHEGQHIWDITMAQGMWPYRLRDDLVIRPLRLTNFNRSEILTVHAFVAMDMYAPVYLMGGSGMQGFNTLLDEYCAYVHSLAAKYCTRDSIQNGGRTSARDGILTMMYYVEMYLKLARTLHPADYAAITGDREHIRLILTNWARAEFYLNLTGPISSLGLNDTMIRTYTYDPVNLEEINRLRSLPGAM